MIESGSYHSKKFFQADLELKKLHLNVTIASPSDCCVWSVHASQDTQLLLLSKFTELVTAVKAGEFH